MKEEGQGTVGNEIYANRIAQQKQLRSNGVNPYPNNFIPANQTDQLRGLEQPEQAGKVSVAGRLLLLRRMGKSAFATLEDAGGRLQLHASGSSECLAKLLEADLGDIIYAAGELFHTKRGELTIRLEQFEPLAKCLRPLPEKHKGLTDPELRARQRHIALLTDADERLRYWRRAELISSLRKFFDEQQFLEVETPMMHPIPGGATARPFKTHHQALDMELYLRVAPELYLKRLLVGGFNQIYEINRAFRNEGVSAQHNPEFTLLEFYAAYQRYTDLMDLIEKMFAKLVKQFAPSGKLSWRDHEINFSGSWKRLPLSDSLCQYCNLSKQQVNDREVLANRLAGAAGSKAQAVAQVELGSLQALLFEKEVEDQLIQPTFITDYPASVSPLARRNDNNLELADRFELFIGGQEIANGFSEQNDPQVQAEVFKAQAAKLAGGDQEAMHFDTDYIEALESGMPPAAGAGIGIDRLTMLMLGCDSIRDVLLFPLVRKR